jgi:hypothetical protein
MLSVVKVSVIILSIAILNDIYAGMWRHDTQHNDIQHNDI